MKAETTTLAPVPSRKRRFFRWMRYLLTALVALLIALVCAGAIYEGIESRRDRRQYHAPGQLVDIGGYRLHLYCLGEVLPRSSWRRAAEIHGFPGTRCSRE
jgi:hypothetical protein